MSVQEVVQQVSYVTSSSGQPTAVQIQIDVWQEVVALLEQAMATQTESTKIEAAWDLFLGLADDAQPGTLENPSTNHDTYLHGQPKQTNPWLATAGIFADDRMLEPMLEEILAERAMECPDHYNK